ncbi:60S ribosomal protein L14, partial [Nowakowskiella sp. JEL0078]
MVFKKFVEVGRVVLVTYGTDAGKLAVVVGIIDHNRVRVARQSLSFKRLSLTPLIVKVPALVGTKALTAIVAEANIVENFAKTSWGKKLANRSIRESLNDFDRFKLFVAKKE